MSLHNLSMSKKYRRLVANDEKPLAKPILFAYSSQGEIIKSYVAHTIPHSPEYINVSIKHKYDCLGQGMECWKVTE